jgi:flagellar basal-body rod protein FlgF
MNVSLYQAAAAMNANARWQELIAENLVSGSTPGARKQAISFSAVEAGLAPGAPGLAGSRYVIPRANTAVSFQAGELRRTGNTMDFALEGPGFFEVQLPNGDRAYTRDGEFQLNAQGQLVTKQGYIVLTDAGPLQLDPNNAGPLTISASGDVSQGSEKKGRLQIVEFNDPRQLTIIGGGLFRTDNPNLRANNAGSTSVRQGFIEAANTSPTIEMASLITAMRMFESNQRVLQMQDERMGRVISELGSPT